MLVVHSSRPDALSLYRLKYSFIEAVGTIYHLYYKTYYCYVDINKSM